MPDMYDKLGDLLSEALESGNIKQESSAKAEKIQDRDTSSCQNIENCDKSGLFYFNHTSKFKKARKKIIFIPKKEENTTGEVVKMHKYTEIMHIPQDVQSALTTLDIAYPYNWIQIKHKYRLLLKQNHPDNQNTIQQSNNVSNNRHLTIDKIKESYEILKIFFGK